MTCACAELRDTFTKRPLSGIDPGKTHSCEYVSRRNALIPEAMKIATIETGDRQHRTPTWTTSYMGAMTRLAAEAMRAGRL